SEDERLALLRQCVISKADYVEIELESAQAVRRFGTSKRVISYTNLKETPADIDAMYDQCRGRDPDVVKLVSVARTPEEAWPLVQIVARSPVPTVVVGLGRANTMLCLLGKKLGAPWVYAALERGMEAYPGQPTVDDLTNIFRFESIVRSTKFIGVIGQSPRDLARIACLNAAFAECELNLRCLPLEVGNPRIFRKLIDVVKLQALVADEASQERLKDLDIDLHGTARKTSMLDVIVPKDDGLHGFHKGARACLERLGATLDSESDRPLKDRIVMLAGLTPWTSLIAAEVQAQGGNAVLASNDKGTGLSMAREHSCRYVQWEAIYSTLHDVLIVMTPDAAAAIQANYVKPGQAVVDLTAHLTPTPLLIEAERRGALVVSPIEIFLDETTEIARMLTAKPIEREMLREAIPERLLDH
ncbi:MAG TPA: type I 3-dehydroquinate dehydratase, partial [Gemmataceae bacterium]|nr:type I 3-dehydroquinate dehydratase [Gemmataceae bacterium]